jgi:hypothetical protein
LSDFAALLYTWMIPHADDDCRLVAKDAEEINLLVVPNRRKTDAEVTAALDELFTAELIGQDEIGHYFLPSANFYKYQSKIPLERRVLTPKPGRAQLALPLPISTGSRPSAPFWAPKGASSSSSLSLYLKSPSKSAGAVDNSTSKKATEGNPYEPLLRLAAEIAGKDHIDNRNETAKKLVQWTVSMLTALRGEPQDRVLAVTRSSLEIVRAKIDAGYEIKSLWGLLTVIFEKERTKYIQGPENRAYKNAPLGQFGQILQKIAANGIAMEGGP